MIRIEPRRISPPGSDIDVRMVRVCVTILLGKHLLRQVKHFYYACIVNELHLRSIDGEGPGRKFYSFVSPFFSQAASDALRRRRGRALGGLEMNPIGGPHRGVCS